MSAIITLHIGTLSLPGLTAAEAARAARSFEAELTALLERHGLPPAPAPPIWSASTLARCRWPLAPPKAWAAIWPRH